MCRLSRTLYVIRFQRCMRLYFFFFNDTATTEIYTLSLHDALPISLTPVATLLFLKRPKKENPTRINVIFSIILDRKSTRLNSSHLGISYAVFCLKKKKKRTIQL